MKKIKVLAVASGGGHWVQLLRLRPAFDGTDLHFLSTNSGYASEVDAPLFVVTDANMWNKLKLIRMFFEVFCIVLKLRPDVIITTGAAPGFAALMFGKLIRARTVWIDSIANSEQLSSSGKQARRFADAWVTQWAPLSTEAGAESAEPLPQYWGSVL